MEQVIAKALSHSRSLALGSRFNQWRAFDSCSHGSQSHARRSFGSSQRVGMREKQSNELNPGDASHSQPAHKISQKVTEEEKEHYDKVVEHSKESQMRAPWMREGSDIPPVARLRSAGAMTKGKLLTTPSRMLKLILPLTTKDVNKDRKDVEPLALLVHPQQPLSYLERLIQSELPVMQDDNGKDKIPAVHFRAQDSGEEAISPDKQSADEHDEDYEFETAEDVKIDGKTERTGKLNQSGKPTAKPVTESKEPGPESAQEVNSQASEDSDSKHADFVRWSPSTEIGDFIRDAARGKEFSVDIEGTPGPIYVAVPSFSDRTYYLRMRLRKTGKQISKMADIKTDCDKLANRGAQRVAQGGFAILVGWWYLVYRLTFTTDLGWDMMEPVTYLVGLSTLIGGYMWFLYHNREVSYQSAMNFTISKRQNALYEQKGFDLAKWESLVEEGNRLRREVKLVAEEYDVDWDERKDEGDEKVSKALRQERKKRKNEDDDDKDEKKKKNVEDDD